MDIGSLIKSAKAQGAGEGALPVEKWHPEYCGEMDMVIRRDGTWWHEGAMITRKPLVKLFSSILRKDEDEETYLVTPAEKIKIKVECAHFIAARVDVQGNGVDTRLFFTTNMDETIEAGPGRALTVQTDPETMEPMPLLRVRGRLDALLARPVFYELVNIAEERDLGLGPQLGVYSGGEFFPLGPPGIHNV